MSSQRAARDLLVCVSLVNLCFLRVWAQLLPGATPVSNLYYMRGPPARLHYVAALLGVAVLAGAAWGLGSWARRSGSRGFENAARAGFLGALLLAANAVRDQLPFGLRSALHGNLAAAGVALLALACAGAAAWSLWRRPARLFRVAEGVALALSPFALLTASQAIWTLARHDGHSFGAAVFRSPAAASALPARGPGSPRVVWIVFDELEQRAAFSERPPDLVLPAFDRLRSEALFATHAYPPAGDTRLSMAAYLLGLPVERVEPKGVATLACALEGGGGSEDCWEDFPNLFARARDAGFNAAVAGWYYPYCRLFERALTACAWAGLPYWEEESWGDSIGRLWEELLRPVPLVRTWLSPSERSRRAHLRAYREILGAALAMVSDPAIGLALLHFPVPHRPDIFDRQRGVESVEGRNSYLDNLALADRTLAALRRELERGGLWDATTLIVTSDHWWRALNRDGWGLDPEERELLDGRFDKRVPFLVRLPGQTRSQRYEPSFNTLLLHDLVLERLAARLGSPGELVAWLDARRTSLRNPHLQVGTEPRARAGQARIAAGPGF